MTLLETISGPRDLDALRPEQLDQLAREIREYLVESVSKTGGHLGPNLGVVEMTHRHPPGVRLAARRDRLRHRAPVATCTSCSPAARDLSTLRTTGGLAGYPQRSESEHDIVESSHASSSLSGPTASRAPSR